MKRISFGRYLLIFILLAFALQESSYAQDGSSGEGDQEPVTRTKPPDDPNLLPGADPVMNNLYRSNSDTLGAAASMRNKFGVGSNYSPLNSALSGEVGEESADKTLHLENGARGDAFVTAPSNPHAILERPDSNQELIRAQKSPVFLHFTTGEYVNPVYIRGTDFSFAYANQKNISTNTARLATVESNRGEAAIQGTETYMGCIAENSLLGQDIAQTLCSNDAKIFQGNPPPNTKVGMDFTFNRSSKLNTANKNNVNGPATPDRLLFTDIIFTQAIATLKEKAKTSSGTEKTDADNAAAQLEKFRIDTNIMLGDAVLVMEKKPNGVFDFKTEFFTVKDITIPYETLHFKRLDDAYNRLLWLLMQRCSYANSRKSDNYEPFKIVTFPIFGIPISIPMQEGFYSTGVDGALGSGTYKEVRKQFGFLSLNQSFLFSQELLEVLFQLFEDESDRKAPTSGGDASSSGGGTRGVASEYDCKLLDWKDDKNKVAALLEKIKQHGPTFISDRLKIAGRFSELISHAQLLEAYMLLQERLKQITTVVNVEDNTRNALYGAIDALIRRGARLRADESLEGRYSLVLKDISELLMTMVQLSQNSKGKSGQYFGHLMTGRESGNDSGLAGR